MAVDLPEFDLPTKANSGNIASGAEGNAASSATEIVNWAEAKLGE